MTDINNKIQSEKFINMDDLEIDETLKNELSSYKDIHCELNYHDQLQSTQIHVGELYEYEQELIEDFKHEQLPELLDFLHKYQIDYININHY
jgi:DNA-binding transcriptional regulator WhiA